jgi:hypothetical protein
MRTKIKHQKGDVGQNVALPPQNPATSAGYPEGTQPKPKEDAKGPIWEIKGKRFWK